MPRKKTASLVRDIPADRIYGSVPLQRLINRVMLNGKKQIAERLVYGGLLKAARRAAKPVAEAYGIDGPNELCGALALTAICLAESFSDPENYTALEPVNFVLEEQHAA